MNSRMDKLYKGLLSLTVMLMFAAALIAAQARANLVADRWLADDVAAETPMSSMPDHAPLGKLKMLPQLIDTVALALPIVVELGADDCALDGNGRHDARANP